MIKDKTLDEALIELIRTKKALEALRSARKEAGNRNGHPDNVGLSDQIKEHAAAKRATLDLTRKLADLRQGR